MTMPAERANPLGTKGFSFIEFASQQPDELVKLFTSFGFQRHGQHKKRAVTLFSQGRIHLLVNAEPGSHAVAFSKVHGPSVPAMGWLMEDVKKVREYFNGFKS